MKEQGRKKEKKKKESSGSGWSPVKGLWRWGKWKDSLREAATIEGPKDLLAFWGCGSSLVP